MLVGTKNVRRVLHSFDKLADQDQFSWNSFISTCVASGKPLETVTMYREKEKQASSLHRPFLALLKACVERRDLQSGQDIHGEIMRKGLFEKNIFVRSALIDMYVKCGSLMKAQEVFDQSPVQNVVSWTTLIAGYAEYGEAQEVFERVRQMQHEGVYPDAFTFVCMLKACGSFAVVDKDHEVHAEIMYKGLDLENSHIGSALISMYINSGFLEDAQKVFANLGSFNVITWTVIITGLSEHGNCENAFRYFDCMQHKGISPNSVTYVCGLKCCASMKAFDKGQEIHADVVKRGLEEELQIGNTLVDMYAKCGSLEIAQQVFDKLKTRTVVSWNSLISAYAEYDCQEEVLNCYRKMHYDSISPDVVTFVCCLKAFASLGDGRGGQEMHAMIVRAGFEREILIGSTLVDTYIKWGLFAAAAEVFDQILVRDVVVWNVLLAGLALHGFNDEVLMKYEKMQCDCMAPNAITFSCILKACVNLGALDKCKDIHADITKKGLENELPIGNALIDMYITCSFPQEALRISDMLLVRDVVSWNTLISGYAALGYGKESLSILSNMRQDGVFLDIVTFVCILKACGSSSAITEGQEMYSDIIKQGLENDLLVGSTLVDMYSKSGFLLEAERVFDKLPRQTLVAWNALLVGFLEHCEGEKALVMLEKMQDKGICLDVVSLGCGLRASGSVKDVGHSQELHAEIVRRGLERDIFIGNILVDVYAKVGLLSDAQDLVNKSSVAKDVVAWTALLSGFIEHGRHEEAFVAFDRMQQLCIVPNAFTFVFGLKACGSMGAMTKCVEIHVGIVHLGLEEESLIGNCLLDTYAKFGLLAEAQQVFDKLVTQDVVAWNALIAGYALYGESEAVFKVFDMMIREGMEPNLVTLVSVLNTCAHTGLLFEGVTVFKIAGFMEILEHYTCIVDLLGRAGQIDRVIAAMEILPLQPDIAIWHTALGACQKHGFLELGRHAFEQAVELDNNNVAAYVTFSNVCADAG